MKESISIVIIKIKIVNTNNFILDPKRLTILAVYKLLFNYNFIKSLNISYINTV